MIDTFLVYTTMQGVVLYDTGAARSYYYCWALTLPVDDSNGRQDQTF